MTEGYLEHLQEQLESALPDGFALFYNLDGEFGDPLVWFPQRMHGRFLGENIEYWFPQYWGEMQEEEVTFTPDDGFWEEDED